ncbi:MAG: leucine-rich repeat protein, partial [Clostridia bacterium]|nr:leucine-rich repeat protein [Clostridia bacterium]
MGVFSGCKSLKNITLPSSLLTIRENAFEGCVGISGLIIPTSVKTIEKNALNECTGLKDLTISFIGETVEKPYTLADLFGTYDIKLENIRVRGAKYIGSNTFSGFNSLVSVNIGGMVESIDNYCFSDCKNLKSVVLSDTVTSIGNGAFFNCEALESIDLPDNITSIPNNAFTSCSSLNDIDIPEGVTEIGIQAFKGCTSLENIDWLSNITNLGYGAFEGCESVESAEINSAITVIPAQIFKGCIGITSIKLPDATVEINAEAFEGCEKLAQITVPDSVTSVGEKAFAECTSLTELVLSDKVTSIGEGFADSCTGIKEITIPFLGSNVDSDSTLSYVFGDTLPEGLKKITITADNSIADKAFYGCVSLEEISLNEGIESIGSCAFSNCTGITSITIPDSVASIGSRAFEFTSLTSLTVPSNTTSLSNEIVRGVTTIEEISVPHIGNTKEKVSSLALLFNGGSVPDNLKKITVTNSTSIEERAFYGCRYIEEIVLDCDITEMGSYAFGECSSLVEITLPDTLTTVGEYCFYYDEKLESIVFPDSVEYFGRNVLYGCNNIAAVTVPFVGLERNDANSFCVLFSGYNWEFPDSVKSITVTNETVVKDYSFQSLDSVEEIIYTKGMEAIGTSAFGGCYRLKTIELGDSLKTIGDWAFESCMNIDTVVLPESLEHIGIYAFISCYNLNEVYNFSDIQINTYDDTCLRNYCMAYRTDDTPVTKVKANGLEFILGDNGLWYFNKYDKGIEEIVFPLSFMNGEEEITEYNIPNYSFTRNRNIKSVTLTKAIKYIDYDTFYGCDNLRQVYNLSDLDLVRGSHTYGYVAYYAYVIHNNADAEKLVEVTIDDFVFTKTGNEWFLIKYTGTANKLTLGEFSYGDTTVSSYEITDGVFRYSSISELVITDAVKKLGNESFYNITNLKKVSFEDNSSITVIPSNCFNYCYDLEQVVLPSSLTKIEYGAFENCRNLIEIYNLSEMELTIGSSDNGYVARYAFIIHKSMDEEPLTETRIGKFLYWHSDDLWVVKSYSGTDKKLELGSFEYNGKTINAYSIMSEAFSYNSYLEEIIIGDEVKSIGEGAFKSCYNLKKVSFENNTSITVIPQSAFIWNGNLEMVILPSSLESIDSQAFSDCQKLIELYNLSDLELECGSYDHGNVARYAYVIHKSMDETPLQNIEVEGYQFMSDGDSIWLFKGYTGEKDTLDFKGLVYNEKEIKGITVMPYSLQDNTVVKKLILGEEIAKLSPNAFNGSTFLTYVSLKDCENITIIPEYAFSYCRNLSTVILSEHITGILYDAFWQSNSIYNVCNLSSLEITAGSDMYGYIAKYAKNVCTSEDDIIEITHVESGNQIYQFINEDGEWNLISSSA